MSGQPSPGARLRALLTQDAPVLAPGCGDAFSARQIEAAGFPVAFMSGGWTSANLGYPDVGLVTLNEMAGNARAIAQAVSIPIIADADTGFGGYVNIRRCVREFELAGVAGIQIEDQGSPKKCGLMPGKKIVPAEEMAAKVEVAVEARSDDDFIIVARTDAIASEGADGAIERGRAYFAAGADVLFVEAFQSEEQIQEVGEAFVNRLLLFNRTPRGHTPLLSLERLRELGYSLVVYPMHLTLAAARVQAELLREIRETGGCDSFEDRMLPMNDYYDVLPSPGADETAPRSSDR